MKDIASEANISVVTVSRALNNKPDISKKTKEDVLRIARNLDYTPNVLAQSLVTKDTKTVGIIIPNARDPFYASVIDGISNETRNRGYGIFLCNSHEDPDEELELIKLLRSKWVNGMLIYPLQEDSRYINELQNNQTPFVFLNRHSEKIKSDYVINDNYQGSFLVIDHLIKKGYKNIVYVCAKPTASSGQERIEGCKGALRKHGFEESAMKVLTCDESIECCYNLVLNLLSDNVDIDAMYIWDDRLAIGASRALFESNIKIPEDIALVGYDDIEVAEFLYPPLTTVRQPTFQIGQLAARILIDKFESGNDDKLQQIVLKPELIVRATT